MNEHVWPAHLQPQPAPRPQLTRDQAIQAWRDARGNLAKAAAEEIRLRNLITGNEFPQGVPEGTNTVELGNGYKIKITGVNNFKLDKDNVEAALDAIEATGPEGKFLAERLVAWKPELSVAEYRTLPANVKKIIDTVLTIKPGQSQLEFVEPKAKS